METHTYSLGQTYRVTKIVGSVKSSTSWADTIRVLVSVDKVSWTEITNIVVSGMAVKNFSVELHTVSAAYVRFQSDTGYVDYSYATLTTVDAPVYDTVMVLTAPTAPSIVQGQSVVISGTLKTTGGTPVGGKPVGIYAAGTDYENRAHVATVNTNSSGVFTYTIPGSFYTAISESIYDKAIAGAIFFGDSGYETSEDEAYFLVESSVPCPDGIDPSECYASSGCELGTNYCENGTLLQCQQRTDCLNCYVDIGDCEQPVLDTVISIVSSDYEPCIGDTINVGGVLLDENDDPVIGAVVRLQYGLGLEINMNLGTATTDSSGQFTKVVPASIFTQESVYIFRASFDGNAEYSASTNTVGVSVYDCTPGECTNGAQKCVDDISYLCEDEAWVEGGDACETPPVCTNGTQMCLDDIPYTCVDGKWKIGGDACDEPGPSTDNMIYYIIGGVAVVGIIGAALMLRK
jgi:hypothetical protein